MMVGIRCCPMMGLSQDMPYLLCGLFYAFFAFFLWSERIVPFSRKNNYSPGKTIINRNLAGEIVTRSAGAGKPFDNAGCQKSTFLQRNLLLFMVLHGKRTVLG